MNKRAVQLIPSVILYIAAGLVAAFAIWAYTHSADIVSQTTPPVIRSYVIGGVKYTVSATIKIGTTENATVKVRRMIRNEIKSTRTHNP